MTAVFAFSKPKSLGVTLFTINGKRCCSYYSEVRDKEKRTANFNVMQISPKAQKHHVRRETKKPEKKMQENVSNTTLSPSDKVEYRKNALNIQMLSKSLHQHIFGDSETVQVNPKLIEKAKQKLLEHGLMNNENQILEDVSLDLPPLKGKNIAEHFWTIGEEQCKPYRELVESFIKTGIPKCPSQWLCQKGWTKYVEGEEPLAVPFPDDDILVFDVEVCVTLGESPVLATAASSKAWYAWVCPDLAEGIASVPRNWYNTSMLIPFEGKTVSKEKHRIIVGHNVSYDRARIKEQYYLKNSALRFLDTMSLHTCIGGINKTQKNLLDKKTEIEEYISKDVCFCSLKELYMLYCEKELAKENVTTFIEGTILDVKNNFQILMKYCASDVIATYEVLQAVFPIFLNMFSHPVTLAGMLEMGSAFLPVNNNWNKFLKEADQTYEDLKSEISSQLSKKCDKACRLLHNDEYKNDLWMWNEDWSTQELKFTKKKIIEKKKNKESDNKNEDISKFEKEKVEEEIDEEEKELMTKYQYLFDLKKALPKILPFLPGYPLWYRKLCEKPNSPDWTVSPQLTSSMLITPKLLNITWENFPLHHEKGYGWGILIPDLFTKNVQTSIPFEKLKELTIKNCNIDMDLLEREKQKFDIKKKFKESFPTFYYNGSAINSELLVDDCCLFFKIPHVSGDKKNVGNPLSKEISHVFASGTLSSSDTSTGKILDLNTQVSYWRNNRQRICGQMVVWLNKKEASVVNESDKNYLTGVILPKVVVCGTLTRRAMEPTWLTASKVNKNRIGSELRAMIQAPPGYHFVGADVDSQELWIASLIGDSYYAKVHGSTPFGWMTLSGNKASGNDMHSVTAKAIGISRSHAKVINYARIYGASAKFAEKLLKQFNPALTDEEARIKAVKMYDLTKGVKEFKVKDSFIEEFTLRYGKNIRIYDLASALSVSKRLKKKIEDVFEKSHWINGTESSMFNRLEQIATSSKPTTPFLKSRLSRALEPRFEGDDFHLRTRINWVVQSGAVDFLHLMLVCMRWLTNGKARYCFSFHDEVRYMIPTEERYNGALALHITNLFVRSFCSYSLGIYDLPQTVAFFSGVEVDKTLRKEANDDCVTSSNPHGIEQEYGIAPGETLDIYETIRKSGGSLAPFGTGKKRASAAGQSSQKTETIKTEMSQATKRKHVHREVLQGELVPPKENQKIVRVLSSKGSNLHEVETPESTTFLASMPNKFRRNVWIKRGDFILVEPIEEGGKVKAEIVNILTADYIKYLKNENIWPKKFSENTDQEAKTDGNFDDLFVNSNRKHNISETESTE